MNGPKFPALRLPAVSGGEVIIQDAVVLEAASSNRLIVSYASDGPSKFASDFDHSSPHGEGEMHSSDDSGNDNADLTDPNDAPNTSNYEHDTSQLFVESPTFSRTISMPQPAQLVQLSHPHKPHPFTDQSNPYLYPSHSDEPEPFRELSVELADSIQMAIQTMLQISPLQVLDSAREEFSACSLSVPTPSMSAMFTAMKNLNYISANISNFCSETSRIKRFENMPPPPVQVRATTPNDFDLGEALQCVGDALSGAASQIGVDLVLYHSDVGLNSVPVSGDESGVSYALSHIIRQVLSTANTGDSIEIGLIASPPTTPTQHEEVTDDLLQQFIVRISHKYGTLDNPLSQSFLSRETPPERPAPQFSTLLLRRLLRQINADLVSDLPPPDSFLHGRTCEVKLALKRGRIYADDSPENITLDATFGKLLAFGDTLKGQKVTLYASSKGSFAHHLTSYLTAWGMDVSHVSPEGATDGLLDPHFNLPSSFNATVKRLSAYGPKTDGLSSKKEPTLLGPEPLSFIVIDDDIDVLSERLEIFHEAQQLPPIGVNPRKRPSLATHHRPKSSPQMARLLGETAILHPAPVVILHFTSLSKYKALKDVIAKYIISYAASSTPLPEVMIIPKPAGPRRFLTALHTAVTKPAVDPDFVPNATSPTSPSVHHMNSFIGSDTSASRSASQSQNPTPSKSNRIPSSRSNSDRSTRSTKDSEILPPPASPLGLADNVEYFSEAAAQLGTSPSSGLVIQSPDGQPAGIFFHPRGKSSRNPSSQSMERDKGQLQLPSPFKPDPVSFSSLHEAAVASPILATENKSIMGSPTILPSLKTLSRKQTSPHPNDPPIASDNTIVTTPIEHSSSPITSMLPTPVEGTPSRRALGKRPAHENKTGTMGSANKKDKVPESNIVPPICVLIVDDNPINQTILSTFMKKKKIKYDVANNGQEAVDKWKTGEFHLILMDIQMPIMDGIQATKEIRRLEKSNAMAGYPPCSPEGSMTTTPSRTPSSDTSTSASSETTRSSSSPYRSSVIIVALTASSLSSDRVAALAAGCNDFLTKPVTLLWLNNKIIEWGSIKALQMWADPVRTSQAAQARDVADRLHVPPRKGSPSLSRQVSLGKGSSISSSTVAEQSESTGAGPSSTRTVPAGASRSPPTPLSPGKIWGPFKPSSATRRVNSSEGPSGPPANINVIPVNFETASKALSSPARDLTELRSDSLTPTARSIMPPNDVLPNSPGNHEKPPLPHKDPQTTSLEKPSPIVMGIPEQPFTQLHPIPREHP